MSLEEILNKYKDKEPPIDIQEIALELGIIIEDIPLQKINGMCFEGGNNWYIALNSFLTEEKQRFIIAHELAHIIQQDIGFSSYLISKFDYRETQADDFAAKILTPEKALLEQLEYTSDIGILSKLFKVEKNIIKTRLKEIKI